MTIVRLCRSRYSPKDATGAKLYGGRWNSPGNAVLYASSTLALACLEILVHIRDVGLMPPDYAYSEIDVPEGLIRPWTLTGDSSLAKIESPVLSREFGDAWFSTMTSPEVVTGLSDLVGKIPAEFHAHLRHIQESLQKETADSVLVQAVPSVIVPREMNYLINPAHPKFDQLVWSPAQAFRFDPRLVRSTTE
jgi:RES domain-containing protein